MRGVHAFHSRNVLESLAVMRALKLLFFTKNLKKRLFSSLYNLYAPNITLTLFI
jgi:hypothetical protein